VMWTPTRRVSAQRDNHRAPMRSTGVVSTASEAKDDLILDKTDRASRLGQAFGLQIRFKDRFQYQFAAVCATSVPYRRNTLDH